MDSLELSSAGEINRLHAEICASARTTIEKAIRIGELLTKQKAKLKHGEWLPWLSANVQFSRQTADNYRRIYERREELKLLNVGNLREAYQLLDTGSGDLENLAPNDPRVLKEFDEQFEKLEFRLWKLERAWKPIEAKQTKEYDEDDKRRLVEVIREGQTLTQELVEWTINCERRLGQCLNQMAPAETSGLA